MGKIHFRRDNPYMKRDIKLYINEIIEAINNILDFTKGLSYEDFCNNKLVASAVIRQFEIIGEAAKYIPDDIYSKYTEIPWNYMARTRDRIIHGYFDISYKIIWKSIKEDIPDLPDKLKKILKDF